MLDIVTLSFRLASINVLICLAVALTEIDKRRSMRPKAEIAINW